MRKDSTSYGVNYFPFVVAGVLIGLFVIIWINDLPKLFSEISLRTTHWTIKDVLIPLGLVFVLCLIVCSLLSSKNKVVKEELVNLRSKYKKILEGRLIKGSPSLEEVKEEMVQKLPRCIKWQAKERILQDLYRINILLSVISDKTSAPDLEKMRFELRSLGLDKEWQLRNFDRLVHILVKDPKAFFSFLRDSLVQERRFEPKAKILHRIVRRHFLTIDNLPLHMSHFEAEEVFKHGSILATASLGIICLAPVALILERILPITIPLQYKELLQIKS